MGNTYAMLITGEQTDGRYCLIDMRVPDGGGPPPHRHDFEEMFTILEGEIEFTFRGEKHTVRAGSTINVPANAPHNFRNVSGAPARMLCMCTPAGQDEYFMRIGDVVAGKDAPPPQLSQDELAAAPPPRGGAGRDLPKRVPVARPGAPHPPSPGDASNHHPVLALAATQSRY